MELCISGFTFIMVVLCKEKRLVLQCAMPVRVMKVVGVKYLIATNVAGGINEMYKVGDIMVVKDHVNFMGLAGFNPLRGFNDDR
jgi:purine-nucleoside phosphorylase